MSDINEQPLDAERQMDHLLTTLGKQGILDDVLNDEDLDQLLSVMPVVPLSDTFHARARAAMTRAQQERLKQNPAIAFGAILTRARQQMGLALAQVGQQIGVEAEALDNLEAGRLSFPQILYVFPVPVTARLITILQLPVDEFKNWLMEFTSAGGRTYSTATSIVHRAQQPNAATIVTDVAEYIAAVERSVATQQKQ